MHWIRFCFAALLALFAQVLVPSVAQAKWLKAETRHFVIYSSSSEKDLRSAAVRLERFDTLLKLKFGFKDADTPIKLTIYYLEDETDVRALTRGWARNASGFFASRLEGSFAVAHRDKANSGFGLDGGAVLLHEYGHYFMKRYASFAYPSWYVEGFAEFVSTTTIDQDGNWTMGKPANHRANSLLRMPKISIEKLLFGNPSEMKQNEISVFYGRSWLLTHMMLTSPDYNSRLSAFFAAVARGKDHRTATAEAFGDLKRLDLELDRYLGRPIPFMTSKVPLVADSNVSVTPLDPVSEQLMPLALARSSTKGGPELTAALRKLAQANPNIAEPWYQLAMAERWEGIQAEKDRRAEFDARSEAAIDKALAIEPTHARANVIKAELLMKRLQAAGDKDPAHWTAARAYLITANKVAQDDPMVLIAWYDSFQMQGRKPSQTARDALARAFALAPEVPDLRARYALDLADQGRFDDAISIVQTLAFDPHGGQQGQALLRRIEAMRAGAKAASGQGTTAPDSATKSIGIAALTV